MSKKNDERKKYMKTIMLKTALTLGAMAAALVPIGANANPGDLYVTDQGGGQVYQYTPGGTQSTFATGLTPLGLAFDSSGNLFVAAGNGTILKFTGGVQSTFATGLA